MVAYAGQVYYTSKFRRFGHEHVKCHHKEMACYQCVVTRKGLLALCQLKLNNLNISKVASYICSSSYGDEEALIVARHIPCLYKLRTPNNEMGWEGVTRVASSLIQLETLDISGNKKI